VAVFLIFEHLNYFRHSKAIISKILGLIPSLHVSILRWASDTIRIFAITASNVNVFKHQIGIKLNEHMNIGEYYIREGCIAVASDKALDRKGNTLLIKFKNKVKAFFISERPVLICTIKMACVGMM
jgi:hypothetical protein